MVLLVGIVSMKRS